MLNLKQLLISGIASLILMTGITGTAVVGAQDDPTTPEPRGNGPSGMFSGPGNGPGGMFGDHNGRGPGGMFSGPGNGPGGMFSGPGNGPGGMFGDHNGRGPRGGHGGFGLNINRAEVEVLLETYTGLTPDELRTEIRDGATLAELIEANGQSVDAFVAEAAAPVYERIDEAVANGRIDETQAETLKAEVTERLAERLQTNPPRRNNPVLRQLDGEMLALAESYTGLTAQEIATELRDGATLADLITANDGDVDAFIAEAVTVAETRIDERTAEQKSMLPGMIEALVNGERPNVMPPIADSE